MFTELTEYILNMAQELEKEIVYRKYKIDHLAENSDLPLDDIDASLDDAREIIRLAKRIEER